MCYIPDYYDKWSEYNRQQEEALNRLPECDYCGEHIQEEHCFVINDEIICEGCMMEHFRNAVDDIVCE